MRKKVEKPVPAACRYTEYDCHLFHEGTHEFIYRKMGAHPANENGVDGTWFTLWAPNARKVGVSVWDPDGGHYMELQRLEDGTWELFFPHVHEGAAYQFLVMGADGIERHKADPYALRSELRPGRKSIVTKLDTYTWNDADYRNSHSVENALEQPMSIYEVHLGSWKKDYRLNDDGFLNYRSLADQLAEYLQYMGFTHVELIGISEYPLDASWGYQVTGYYSPTARYGTPDDFRYFVDKMHQSGIGVILDWVPAHFPKDDFGLEKFDGTPLYEYADPLRSDYPEWGTKAFDHGRPEVQSFLIANAFYWVQEFHVDALRVDAVAAMLYNSFGRSEWYKNMYGGDENLESFAFLRKLNAMLKSRLHSYLIAEDSSIIKGITDDTEDGGFGFLLKWNMGWMNDTLRYVKKDPLFRGWHHYQITQTADYAFNENYVLVLSHDEVVHLKHSMLEKFPGSLQDKLGGLKTLYVNQMTFPGKKLLFMGQEFAEDHEWSEEREINWGLASDPGHRDVMNCLRKLLQIYRTFPCLYSDSRNRTTFEWVNQSDAMRSTFTYIRRNPWNYESALLIVSNFSPVQYDDFTCGAPVAGSYRRIFSSYDFIDADSEEAGFKADAELLSEESPCDGYDHLIRYHLRPYESLILEIPNP